MWSADSFQHYAVQILLRQPFEYLQRSDAACNVPGLPHHLHTCCCCWAPTKGAWRRPTGHMLPTAGRRPPGLRPFRCTAFPPTAAIWRQLIGGRRPVVCCSFLPATPAPCALRRSLWRSSDVLQSLSHRASLNMLSWRTDRAKQHAWQSTHGRSGLVLIIDSQADRSW